MLSAGNFALKSLFNKLEAQENVPLAPYTTIKVGGKARFFIGVDTVQDLQSLQLACLEHQINMHILSGGSNTLFSDNGYNGVVLKLGPFFNRIEDAQNNTLRLGAATSFAKVTKLAVMRGWPSAVGWGGVPGLIGGAIRMNAGTKAGEIGDAVISVTGIMDGKLVTLKNHQDIMFSYRSNNLPSNMIITEAVLGVDNKNIEPAKNLLAALNEYHLKRKKTQPTINSAGSFFKNPYPKFAAELIENCNLKGLEYGGAQISKLHANFIVNKGNASANDIISVAQIAQKTVHEKFGIKLLPEIRLVGDFSAFQ